MALVIELSPTIVGSEWLIPSTKGPTYSSPPEWDVEIYYDWNDIIGVGPNNGNVAPDNPSGNSYIFVLKNIKVILTKLKVINHAKTLFVFLLVFFQ